VSEHEDASRSGAKAKESAIEAAVRFCRDDGRALAALGIFMWKLADGRDFAVAERAFLDAVLRVGGDWLAAKRTIARMVTELQSDSPIRGDDDHI